jgi:uncharacterized protein (TIGR01777 family)
MKIVIPGGSGHVGRVIVRAFSKEGHECIVLSRGKEAPPGARVLRWDGRTRGEWYREIDGADVVINLAGFSVDCRYHTENRARIMNSRVDSTRVLGEAIAASKKPPRLWMNASTATIYRHALDRTMDEIDGELGGNEPGAPEKWNFSIDVAKSWERVFFEAETPGVRKVAMRSAMTMSPDRGSVFHILSRLVRAGLGGRNGDGRQYMSWIHQDDFTRALSFLIEREDLDGAINISSPNPIPNADFMAALRRAWRMPLGLPATAWMIEIGSVFLRTESELILKSRRVVPRRLQDAGFTFTFPDWTMAAQDLVRRFRAGEGR